MDTTPLTFEPWADPSVDGHGIAPDSHLSRLTWLPLIGPSSWLIWGTLSAQLRLEPAVEWQPGHLAAAHGLSPSVAPRSPLNRTLVRLTQFRLLAPIDETRWLVRLSAPPLSRSLLNRLPEYAVELHRQVWMVERPA